MNNFPLALKRSQFTHADLVYVTKSNKIKSMLGISPSEKVNQVHYRQKLVLETTRKIINLTTKKKFVGKQRKAELDKVIAKFTSNVIELHIEVAKFKAAAIVDMEPEIKNETSYEEALQTMDQDQFIKLAEVSAQDIVDHQIMERILLENSNLFTRFVAQVLAQSEEESTIPLLSKTAARFGYKLTKLKQEQLIS